jgi:hypothetical protein
VTGSTSTTTSTSVTTAGLPGTRGLWLYALASAGIIAVAAGAFALYYDGPARRVALLSAVVAYVLQMLAFAVARLMAAGGNVIAGWGLGAIVCLVSLVIYGFVCRAAGLPTDAGMISLATYFFLTEVIEPPFLSR